MISGVAAFLGGHLVYKKKIGIDHTADYSPPEDLVSVLPETELPENQLRRVDADGMSVLLCGGPSAFTRLPKRVRISVDLFQRESRKTLPCGVPGMDRVSRWKTVACSKGRRCMRSPSWRSGYRTVKLKCASRIADF